MIVLLTALVSSYATGAALTFLLVEGSFKNRALSALLWFTFPIWPV